jgi:hypothetical protein
MADEILTLNRLPSIKIGRKDSYRLAAEGKLLGFKVGGSWHFT